MPRYKTNYKVVAYKFDGSLYRIYDSALQASKSKHCYKRSIDKCIRGERVTAFNLLWRRYPSDSIPNSIEPYIKKKHITTSIPIAEINIAGEIIRIYPSIRAASVTLNIDSHSIRDVLNGKYSKCNGHMFRLLNKDELENI